MNTILGVLEPIQSEPCIDFEQVPKTFSCPESVLVIMNPFSGKGNALRVWSKASTAFSSRRIKCELKRTESSGHATRLAAEFGKDFRLVVVIGGDGYVL